MPTRIKICGFTRSEDVRAAAAVGVDAFGFNFCEASPRCVDVATAAALVAELPPLAHAVGLFVDAPRAQIEAVLAAVPLTLLQFHGDEDAATCESFGRPYLKVLRMREGVDVDAAMKSHPRAAGLLLDAWDPEQVGGTGRTFDWTRAPRGRASIVLAGGLDAGNVERAVLATRPGAVDAASGVEREPGVKDAARMAAFVAAVRAADQRIEAAMSTGTDDAQEQHR